MNRSTPIKPDSVRTVYEGRIFTIGVESITLPRGHRLDVEVVRHPGSVVLLPMTSDGKVVLVRQYRHAIGRQVWELPAGSLKPGEDPVDAARRECQEEIGLIPATLERLGGFFPTPGYCDEEMVFFLATGLRKPDERDPLAQPDEDEDIESRAFGVAELRQMVARGEVCDLKTVAGLAFLPR